MVLWNFDLLWKNMVCQEGPFRTQLRLNRHSMYVCVLGLDPEAPTAWLEGEMEPEEGELFLASPAVKNNQINRNLFFPG